MSSMSKTFGLVVLLGAVVAACTAAFPFELGAGLGVSSVRMRAVNEAMEDMAERQGARFSPLKAAVQGHVELWAWEWLGFRAGALWSSGGVEARHPDPVTAVSLVGGTVARVSLPLLGWPLTLEGGMHASWGWLVGPLNGSAVGLGVSASAGGPVFGWGPLAVELRLGGRYLSSDEPPLDFSGVYLEFMFTRR